MSRNWMFNPITYGILTFRQLRGRGLFGPNPENKVTVNGLIWNFVLIMVWMKLVNMQNFKLMASLLWRYDVTKISLPKWNKSSLFDIYLLDSSKTRQKSLFMPENTFFGTKLYPLRISIVFKQKQKFHSFNFSRRLISKTIAAIPLMNRFC